MLLCTRAWFARLSVSGLAVLALSAAPAAADPIKWAQPGGAGSALTLTYGFSNLLDGGFNSTLSSHDLRSQVAMAFGVWARYAPLHFLEIPGTWPAPAPPEPNYIPGSTPQILFGYVPVGFFGEAAHAHFPPHPANAGWDGLAGDIHFVNDISGIYGTSTAWGNIVDDFIVDGRRRFDFFSFTVHEIGHAIGLMHMDNPSVMYPYITSWAQHEFADLHPKDIVAVRALYGQGIGSVRPLGTEPAPVPEPASLLLVGLGLAPLVRRRLLNRRAAALRN